MVRFLTLGAIQLLHEDRRRANSVLAQSKRLALLAHLVLATRPRRDVLLIMFWPELDEVRARHALSQSLYFLRRALGPGLITTNGDDEVGLDRSKLECDALAFREAVASGDSERVLDLYQGELLPGLHVAGAPEFERWLTEERERFRRSATEAARTLAREATGRGEHAIAASFARRLLEISPFDESGIRLLIPALAASGQRAEALRAYDMFAGRLLAELEVEPAPETQALVEEIRALDTPNCRSASHQTRRVEENRPAADGAVHAFEGGATTSDPDTPPIPAPAAPWPPANRSNHRRKIGIATGGIAAVALIGIGVFGAMESGAGAEHRPDRVVVAPFENRTGDRELDLVGHMAADWITQGFSRTGLIEVIDPATALVFSDDVESLNLEGAARVRALAEATRAGIVVSGSFYEAGDSILFQARITDMEEGELLGAVGPIGALAAEPLKGIERLRARTLGSLASRVDPRIATLTSPSDPPPTYEAYREYIRGLDIFVDGKYRESARYFTRAAELDTTFVLPLIWAAFAYDNNGRDQSRDSVVALIEESRERLSPLESYALEFWLAEGDQEAQLSAARKAAQVAPQSNWTYMVGFRAVRLNRPREAIEALETLDPDRGWLKEWRGYWGVLSEAYHIAGEYRRQLELGRRAQERFPTSPAMVGHRLQALAALGRIEDIERLIDETSTWNENPRPVIAQTARELHAHGYPEAALSLYERTIDFHPTNLDPLDPAESGGEAAARQYMRLQNVVSDLTMLGRLDEARAIAERLVSTPDAVQYIMADEVREAQELYTNVVNRSALGTIAALQGEREEAEEILEWLKRAPSTQLTLWANHYYAAAVAAPLGKREEAVRLIRAALDSFAGGPQNLYRWAHANPAFISLRDYTPFQELVEPRG